MSHANKQNNTTVKFDKAQMLKLKSCWHDKTNCRNETLGFWNFLCCHLLLAHINLCAWKLSRKISNVAFQTCVIVKLFWGMLFYEQRYIDFKFIVNERYELMLRNDKGIAWRFVFTANDISLNFLTS